MFLSFVCSKSNSKSLRSWPETTIKGPFFIFIETFLGLGFPKMFVFAISNNSMHFKLISPVFKTKFKSSSTLKFFEIA